MNKYTLIILLFLFGFISCKKTESETTSLPRSTPEAEGVSSTAILQFIDAVEKSKNEMHGFVFLRHGKVVAEGWWNPYRADLKHTLYSTSKSFTSTAAGFAVSEGLFSVEDKVISFFPDQLPDSVSSYLAELRIKDLLSMSAGQEPDPTFAVVTRDSNWVKSFLATPILKKPGTEFLYNTLATYMVAAILNKVTGVNLIDYLTPRLFEPLGIEGADWEVDPQGITVGGWGLRLKTEDIAKLGQLYLQKGTWNGKQILPEAWIEEATSATIKDNAPYLPEDRKPLSDWAQGYGYQFWRCRYNAYRADGAFGQYIIVMPEQDAVVAINSETSDMQDEINLVWQYLLPAMKSEALPKDEKAFNALSTKLQRLALPVPAFQSSALETDVSGKTFELEANDRNYESLAINFAEGRCNIKMKIDGNTYAYSFAADQWHAGETSRPGPYLIPANAYYVGLPPLQVAGNYTWNDSVLELTLRYIESPHTERFNARFTDEGIELDVQHSQHFGASFLTVKGKERLP
jgi:CubicO group peptidase (beta-lactamase class C family)